MVYIEILEYYYQKKKKKSTMKVHWVGMHKLDYPIEGKRDQLNSTKFYGYD
jgi:hypothetical protein